MSNLFRFVSALALVGLGYALATLQTASQTPVPPDRAALMQRDVRRSEPDAQLVKAMIEPDALTRLGETVRVLRTIPGDRFGSVLASLERVAISSGDPELAAIATWLAQHDPDHAFRWAMSERYASHPWVVSAVLRSWARQDPKAATQAYYSIQQAASLGTALAAVVVGWDEGGHPGLAKFLQSFEQGQTPQIAIEALVQRRIVRDGIEPTIRWAEELPEDDPRVLSRFKRNTMRRVASAVAAWDPQYAMKWASSFGEGSYGRGAYRRVATQTVRKDGLGTMQWLESLPEGPQRDGAVQEGFRTWLLVDRDAALEWIQQQPDAPWLDPAHGIYAQVVVTQDGHEAALERTGLIDQWLRRQRTAQKIGRAWYMREPEAARAWVENAPEWVSDETKETIVAVVKSREPRRNRRQRVDKAAEQREMALDAANEADETSATDDEG